jgi:hypothetical protein
MAQIVYFILYEKKNIIIIIIINKYYYLPSENVKFPIAIFGFWHACCIYFIFRIESINKHTLRRTKLFIQTNITSQICCFLWLLNHHHMQYLEHGPRCSITIGHWSETHFAWGNKDIYLYSNLCSVEHYVSQGQTCGLPNETNSVIWIEQLLATKRIIKESILYCNHWVEHFEIVQHTII